MLYRDTYIFLVIVVYGIIDLRHPQKQQMGRLYCPIRDIGQGLAYSILNKKPK